MKTIKIKIFGDVQGVNFRHEAKKEADELGLKGFAENLPDGSVYIEAEGEDENLERILKWCYTGPETAKVFKTESKISEEIADCDYPDFSIR
ncbi:MAG: acylphosphatase [Patescibacteria group bacterium]